MSRRGEPTREDRCRYRAVRLLLFRCYCGKLCYRYITVASIGVTTHLLYELFRNDSGATIPKSLLPISYESVVITTCSCIIERPISTLLT